ncbi:PREDICTED: protein distal antenna-like [Acromyrmex echinatior]|uniref:protein distal antenna-like n=1 Tax=Acromyrmex echinatior TaxID=103372 RepID=UPI000580E408|nr:PREDICTED: protein distal antenna-like [Acromyrmex echinatior]
MPRKKSRQVIKRPLKSIQEKLNAIMRVHNGESKAAVACDIGVPEFTLRGWCKAEDKIMSQVNNKSKSTNKSFDNILSGIDLTSILYAVAISLCNSHFSSSLFYKGTIIFFSQSWESAFYLS